jgi:signal transduction histidine kinase
MRVANRLRLALSVYVISLVVLAGLYARAARGAAADSRALGEIATRIGTTTDQLSSIEAMGVDAEKFHATNDLRYRDKFAAAYREFGEFEPGAMQPRVLDSLRSRAQASGALAQAEMRQAVTRSETAATRASRVALLAMAGALALGVVFSILLVRSIVAPLERLAQGTRWVSAGRFDYRLDTGDGDEFANLAGDFNAMTGRLGELDRMKKDFVARVSHDLKTPLSSMQETTRALLDHMAGPLTAKQKQLLELNAESGHRLSMMLGKLLDLSRLESSQRPTLHMVDVTEIVRKSVSDASLNAARRGVRLSIADMQPLPVLGDASGIAQVVDNLVENAVKFSPAAGEVRVTVSEGPDGCVCITVADEGPGIPATDRTRVFDRFYQTDAGRAVTGRGVGLGLTICREIVSAHGGRIWIDENTPRGSVFHVALRRGAAAIAAAMLAMTTACAPLHHAPSEPRPEDLRLRIASLTAEIDAVRARLDSTTAVSDSLHLELQRIKDIDLKPRPSSKRPPMK